jgi:hypothetical protein
MKRLFTVLFVAFILSSCGYLENSGKHVSGSGSKQTETRDLGNFDAVEISGAYIVKIDSGGKTSLQIEADDNLLPLIKTEVRGGRLVISSKEDFNTRKSPVVTISMPDVKRVEASGASNFEISGVKNDSLELKLNGASSMDLAGETGKLKVDMAGAGSMDAKNLHAKTVDLNTSGAGSASVYATDALNVAISGVGSVDYYGQPKFIRKNISGFGSLNEKKSL